MTELEPDLQMVRSTLAWAYLCKGMQDEGLAQLEAAVSISPDNTLFLAQLGGR